MKTSSSCSSSCSSEVRPGANGATDFLFNVRDAEGTVRDSAEAAMREVLGRNDIDTALTEGKEQVQQDAQVLLQRISTSTTSVSRW
jgi:membrane protease subunit HflK